MRTRFHTFDSLKIRDFRLLWLGQLCTSSGQMMDQVSRGWLIYQLTGSALELGLVTAARGLPMLVFGILAGAVADRSGRKLQLIVAQVTNAILNLILATLVVTHHVQPWHVYVTGFLTGTVQAFQQPARQTLVSDIVGNKHLLNALALNSAASNGARSIGPAIGGLLIFWVGVAGSYYAQAALFLVATVWTFQMAMPDRSPESLMTKQEPFITSVKDGLGYVGHNREIRTLLILALGPLLLGMPYTSMMPIFAQDVLHGGARLQGLLLTCVGIGALGGALYVASTERQHGYTWVVVVGAMAFCLAILGFTMSRWVPVSMFLLLVVGIFNVTYRTQDQTLAQVLSPRHMRGRVISLYLLDKSLVPLGSLMAGVLATWVGAPNALMFMAASGVVLVAAVSLLTPGFMRVRVDLSEETASSAKEAARAGVERGSVGG